MGIQVKEGLGATRHLKLRKEDPRIEIIQVQVCDQAKPAPGNLKKPGIDLAGINRGTVRILTQKNCGGAAECSSFGDGIESAGVQQIDIDKLSKALTIERAAPGIETRGLEMVLDCTDEGLW